MSTKATPSEPSVTAAEAETKPRRPYRSPELRALGSLRDITWGPTPTSVENDHSGRPLGKGM